MANFAMDAPLRSLRLHLARGRVCVGTILEKSGVRGYADAVSSPSFSCTLLVTEEPGSAIAAHSLVLLDPRRFVGQCKYLPF